MVLPLSLLLDDDKTMEDGVSVRMGSSLAMMVIAMGVDEKMAMVRRYMPGSSHPMCVVPLSHYIKKESTLSFLSFFSNL